LTRAEFEAVWDGRLVLMTRRAALTDLARRFDITWFLCAVHKYRRFLGEVLVASFFLQLLALVSPLFFQVVVDKVLVHRSLSTLDVLVIGLVAISIFEIVLGILRTYLFSHTTNRIDVELGARLFRHLPSAPDRLLPSETCRRFGGARAGAGEHPEFSDELVAHARHRSAVHLRVCGGDVLLLAVVDLDWARLASVLYRDLCGAGAAVPAAPRREIPARRRESGFLVESISGVRGRVVSRIFRTCGERRTAGIDYPRLHTNWEVSPLRADGPFSECLRAKVELAVSQNGVLMGGIEDARLSSAET
jgi:subfamily B ATP-binding cassette protein HlyB/CyaB